MIAGHVPNGLRHPDLSSVRGTFQDLHELHELHDALPNFVHPPRVFDSQKLEWRKERRPRRDLDEPDSTRDDLNCLMSGALPRRYEPFHQAFGRGRRRVIVFLDPHGGEPDWLAAGSSLALLASEHPEFQDRRFDMYGLLPGMVALNEFWMDKAGMIAPRAADQVLRHVRNRDPRSQTGWGFPLPNSVPDDGPFPIGIHAFMQDLDEIFASGDEIVLVILGHSAIVGDGATMHVSGRNEGLIALGIDAMPERFGIPLSESFPDGRHMRLHPGARATYTMDSGIEHLRADRSWRGGANEWDYIRLRSPNRAIADAITGAMYEVNSYRPPPWLLQEMYQQFQMKI